MAHKVFICHSSTDKVVADAACAALEAQRIPCWIAPRDILAGEEYGEAIVEALSTCLIVLVIFSHDANNSPQVRREVERAVSKGKIIVPFRIEDVMPSRAMEFALSNTHWLDALTPPMESYLLQLCETISRLIQRHAVAEAPLWKHPEPVVDEAIIEPDPIPVQARVSADAAAAEAGKKPEPVWEQGRVSAAILTEVAGKKAEPATDDVRATPKPASGPASEAADSPAAKSGWRRLPGWAWGALAVVALLAVFAAGRLLGPHAEPQPSQQALTQPASLPNTNPSTAAAPVAAPQAAEPAPAGGSKPPVQSPDAAMTISPASGPSAAPARPAVAQRPGSAPVPTAAPAADIPNSNTTPVPSNSMSPQDAFDRGLADLKSGQFSEASRLLTVACDGGVSRGCGNLGSLYQNGKGVNQDLGQAAALYRKGCSGDAWGACFLLGVMYESGSGVPKNQSQAIQLYNRSCQGGEGRGCTNLGAAYASGNGVPQNYAQANSLFHKACDTGVPRGCSLLGLAYHEGAGIQKDDSQAALLTRKGCEGGDPMGCNLLGVGYEFGYGVPRNKQQAVALYRQSCTAGFDAGCQNLNRVQR